MRVMGFDEIVVLQRRKSMDTIGSVIEFASSFDLDFPSSIEGSPEPAIQALEQALDRPCLTLLRAIPEEDGP